MVDEPGRPKATAVRAGYAGRQFDLAESVGQVILPPGFGVREEVVPTLCVVGHLKEERPVRLEDRDDSLVRRRHPHAQEVTFPDEVVRFGLRDCASIKPGTTS